MLQKMKKKKNKWQNKFISEKKKLQNMMSGKTERTKEWNDEIKNESRKQIFERNFF